MNLSRYQLFLHVTEWVFGHYVASFFPTRCFLLETCTRKPAWYIFQKGKHVYQEGSWNASFSNSAQDHFRDCDIGIVRFLNRNPISNFHNCGSKCTCRNSLIPSQSWIKLDAYCRMWWKKFSGVTRSRRKNAWTSFRWIGWYLVTALRWKYLWNDVLCFRHHDPYGIKTMLILKPILHQTAFLKLSSLIWGEIKNVMIHTVQSTSSSASCLSNLMISSRTDRWWFPRSLKSQGVGQEHWGISHHLKCPVIFGDRTIDYESYRRSYAIHHKRPMVCRPAYRKGYQLLDNLWALAVGEDCLDYH